MKEIGMKELLNAELSNVLGAKHDWMGLITGVASRRANLLVRSGMIDDVVTDVSSDIIVDARDGTLSEYIVNVKTASKTEAEFVENLRHVMMKVVFYRVSDIMRKRSRASQPFSQINNNEDGDFAQTIVDQHTEADDDGNLDFEQLIIDELELMAIGSEWRGHYRRAAKLRRVKLIVHDRIAGMTLRALMKKHKIGSIPTIHSMIQDIGPAIANVGKRLDNNLLIRGTAKYQSV